MRYLAWLMLLGWLAAPAVAQDAPCGVPPAGDDGWAVAAPAEAGLDATTLCALVPRFEAWKQANVHAVVVVRHDKLVFEHYFTGMEEQPGRVTTTVTFGPTLRHGERSISKSVTSLLLGIAIDRGWVPGVDTTVFSLLPEYADLRTPEKDPITLKHLLTMSSGFAWDENIPYSDPNNSEIRMDTAVNPFRYVLEQPIATPPGALYNYSGGGATLISAVLHKATGQPLDVLAKQLLFDPLGISDFGWRHFSGTDEPMAASGLSLRPRDLVKLGQLVLNHGAWQGKQVVPAAWIAASTAPQIQGSQLYFYGYQWWLGRSWLAGREVDWIAGVGYGGQRLYIVPALDLVVAVNAGLYSSDLQSWVPLQILNRFVLAAVVR